MKTTEELEEKFNITADEIVKIDEDASKGILHGCAVKTVTGPGRPPLSDAPLQQVSFKEPVDKVQAMDRRAEQLGMRRSDYLRQLVENDLVCVGMS